MEERGQEKEEALVRVDRRCQVSGGAPGSTQPRHFPYLYPVIQPIGRPGGTMRCKYTGTAGSGWSRHNMVGYTLHLASQTGLCLASNASQNTRQDSSQVLT